MNRRIVTRIFAPAILAVTLAGGTAAVAAAAAPAASASAPSSSSYVWYHG